MKKTVLTLVLLAFAFVGISAHAQTENRSKNCGCSCCEGLAVCCCYKSTAAEKSDDASAIQQTLLERFDRPDAPLAVSPVVVEADYAIAGWIQADTGGRALLKKQPDGWAPVLCAGTALQKPEVLKNAGIPHATAQSLLAKAAKAEAALTAEQRAKLDAFPGIVPLADDGGHDAHKVSPPHSPAPAPARHPLKGVITAIHADRGALMVKHEEIPGFMRAMTMLLHVDAATLKAARKGQAITGTLVQRDDGFWLEDMKPAAK